MTFIICVVIIVAILWVAYRIYFEKLFEKVKKNLDEEKKYTQIIKSTYGSEKSIISNCDKVKYRDKMESASYECNIVSNEDNGGIYPTINNCENICEKVSFPRKINTSKNLIDAKIAYMFDTDESDFYYRYDDGKLIISNNKSLQSVLKQIKKG